MLRLVLATSLQVSCHLSRIKNGEILNFVMVAHGICKKLRMSPFLFLKLSFRIDGPAAELTKVLVKRKGSL